MNAIEFVKKFGVFGAKEYLAGATFYEEKLMVFTNIDDLKKIVEAFELVEVVGGIDIAKGFCKDSECLFIDPNSNQCISLNKAIELVEKCNASD